MQRENIGLCAGIFDTGTGSEKSADLVIMLVFWLWEPSVPKGLMFLFLLPRTTVCNMVQLQKRTRCCDVHGSSAPTICVSHEYQTYRALGLCPTKQIVLLQIRYDQKVKRSGAPQRVPDRRKTGAGSICTNALVQHGAAHTPEQFTKM